MNKILKQLEERSKRAEKMLDKIQNVMLKNGVTYFERLRNDELRIQAKGGPSMVICMAVDSDDLLLQGQLPEVFGCIILAGYHPWNNTIRIED